MADTKTKAKVVKTPKPKAVPEYDTVKRLGYKGGVFAFGSAKLNSRSDILTILLNKVD